ncbi:hypothetical protein D3C85_1759770 [compost metagenome]
MTYSAYKLPSIPNCSKVSGLQSAFAPTSSIRPTPPLSLGRKVVRHGLMIPGIVLTLNTAPTSIAPELPALAKESSFPSLSKEKPTAILEFGF